MKNLPRLFARLAPTLPLILLISSVINCQPNAKDGIAEKEAEIIASNMTQSPVGAVGLPKHTLKLVKKVDPIYPKIAKKAHVEGSVILEVTG